MAKEPYKLQDGSIVPGVTTVLGTFNQSIEGLLVWASRLGRDFPNKRSDGATVGTCLHTIIQSTLMSEEVPPLDLRRDLEPQLMKAHEAFVSWASTNFPLIDSSLAVEQKIVSENLKVGGCPDYIAIKQGKPWLYDWKTSKSYDPKYLAQVAAYAHLWNEQVPVEQHIHNATVVIFTKKGTVEEYHFDRDELDRGMKFFLATLDTYTLYKDL